MKVEIHKVCGLTQLLIRDAIFPLFNAPKHVTVEIDDANLRLVGGQDNTIRRVCGLARMLDFVSPEPPAAAILGSFRHYE